MGPIDGLEDAILSTRQTRIVDEDVRFYGQAAIMRVKVTQTASNSPESTWPLWWPAATDGSSISYIGSCFALPGPKLATTLTAFCKTQIQRTGLVPNR
jgi:hypothetical protein